MRKLLLLGLVLAPSIFVGGLAAPSAAHAQVIVPQWELRWPAPQNQYVVTPAGGGQSAYANGTTGSGSCTSSTGCAGFSAAQTGLKSYGPFNSDFKFCLNLNSFGASGSNMTETGYSGNCTPWASQVASGGQPGFLWYGWAVNPRGAQLVVVTQPLPPGSPPLAITQQCVQVAEGDLPWPDPLAPGHPGNLACAGPGQEWTGISTNPNYSADGGLDWMYVQFSAGWMSAQPTKNNIPTSTLPNATIATGTDGMPLYITMQNLGPIPWASDMSTDIAGTGSGTCQVDTNGDGVNDCPALTDAPGTSCTVNVSNWSSALGLLHLTSNFVQGAPSPTPYSVVTSNTCTITSVCTSWSGSCSQGSCTSASSCQTPTGFGGCGGIWNPTGGSCTGTSANYSNTPSGNPNVPVNSTVNFLLQSLKAPGTPGSYAEKWQMGDSNLSSPPFGIPLNLSIIVVATPTVTLAATPPGMTLGQSSSLAWTSANTTACTANPSTPADATWPTGSVPLSGSQTVTPSATGTYVYGITCAGLLGTQATATATITVVPVVATPTVTLAATPPGITLGQSSSLAWTSANTIACTANPSTPADATWPTGSIPLSRSQTVTPSATGIYTYGITCNGLMGKQAAATATIDVAPALPTTGTITISSVSSQNASVPVLSTWTDALYNNASGTFPCTMGSGYYEGTSCSGTAETYNNVPIGLFTMEAGLATSQSPLWVLRSVESAPIAVAPAPRPSFALSFLSELIHTADAATSCAYPGALGASICPPSSGVGAYSINIQPTGSANQANFILFWDPVAAITVTPASMPATATIPASATLTASISNSGAQGSTLNWTAASNNPTWLTVSSGTQSGSLAAGNSAPLTVTVNSATLTPGLNTGTVTVNGTSTPTNAKVFSQSLTIIFDVKAPLAIKPPPPVTIPVESPTTLSGNGGSGSYSWSSPAGSPSSGSGATYTTSYAAPGTYVVTLTDTSNGQQATSNVTVVVPYCSPFSANPTTVVPPGQSTLSWTCTNAAFCSITDNGAAVPNGSGVATTTGSLAVAPAPGTNAYAITCSGYGSGPYNTQTFTTNVGTQGTNLRETNP